MLWQTHQVDASRPHTACRDLYKQLHQSIIKTTKLLKVNLVITYRIRTINTQGKIDNKTAFLLSHTNMSLAAWRDSHERQYGK